MKSHSCRRGFILAASISIVFVMVLVAIMIGNKNRVLLGFTMDAETEAKESEGVCYCLAQLRGVMQGNGSPESFRIPNPPPTGSTVLTGTTPDMTVSLDGNLTVAQHSLWEPCGYGTVVPAAGASSIAVPTCHSAAVVTASIRDDTAKPRQKYVSVSTGCYPYGMMALGGFLNVQSARSVSGYDCDPNNPESNISPLMTRVYSSSSLNITNGINGRACLRGGPTPSTRVGGSGGLLCYNCTALALPPDFSAQLTAFKPASIASLNSALQRGFEHIHTAQHHGFPCATYRLSAPVDFDVPNGNLTIGTSLQLRSGDNQELTFQSVRIAGDLYLAQNTRLHLTGSLRVDGNIYLAGHTTLVVDGTTQAGGLGCSIFTSTPSTVDITSTLYGKGTINLSSGMTQGETNWSGETTPTPLANPYPPTIGDPPVPNPQYAAFNMAQSQDLIYYANDGMNNYLGAITRTGVSSVSVPGVFVLSDANLNINSGDKAVGLFVAAGVNLGVKQMVGCVWSTADINAPNTDYRYFPYYQHVVGHVANPTTAIMMAAIEQHPIAYGKLP